MLRPFNPLRGKRPSNGKPDAGDPHVRFGGRGDRVNRSSLPQSIPFEGIVLTDTFQLAEAKGKTEEKMFPENNRRVKRQKQSPIRIVIGNPPYSAQQDSENDNNKNLKYPTLDARIRSTHAARSNSQLVKNLYDSYIRAIRWASDRIADKGIVAFVTNGSFIDKNNMDGLRVSLADEFTSIYVFNLRGNQRTSGETSRMEGGKLFGSGSRAGIAITLFIKNPAKSGNCEIYYHDIGDYLSSEEKLAIIARRMSGLATRGNRWGQPRMPGVKTPGYYRESLRDAVQTVRWFCLSESRLSRL